MNLDQKAGILQRQKRCRDSGLSPALTAPNSSPLVRRAQDTIENRIADQSSEVTVTTTKKHDHND